MTMKKHITVKELIEALSDDQRTMGRDVHCVVVVEGKEYPVVGVDAYDGIFCNVEVGLEMARDRTERRGEEVFVQVS